MTRRTVDPRLDALVNDEGIDQLRASQMLWAPELLDRTPLPPPAPDAPLDVQLRWAGARGRQIVRVGLAAVCRWAGIETDYLAVYKAAKGRRP